MNTLLARLSTIRRPRLLMRAARHGLVDYDRGRELKRIFLRDDIPSPADALGLVIEMEARLEDARRSDDMRYSVARHIELLIAMIAEATLVQKLADDQ